MSESGRPKIQIKVPSQKKGKKIMKIRRSIVSVQEIRFSKETNSQKTVTVINQESISVLYESARILFIYFF